MRIAAVLEQGRSAGGGFNQAVSAIRQLQALVAGTHEIQVFTTIAENVDRLRDLGVPVRQVRTSLSDAILMYVAGSALLRRLQKKTRIIGSFERQLLRQGVDLVYFLAPSMRPASLQVLNYVATVWDLAHREMPEFPEVSGFGEFHLREDLLQLTLTRAVAVVGDSPVLARLLVGRYGVVPERVVIMPFSPAFQPESRPGDTARVLGEYGVEPGYLFYPAQFWPHKNHVRIIEALKLLAARGRRPHIVFVGGDYGNLAYIRRLVSASGVEGQVHFLGFVPSEHMPVLYAECLAVLMPSYFGPTNLPPLEAWEYGKPLISAAHFAGQVGDAAILAEADDPSAFADAMEKVFDAAICTALVARGTARLVRLSEERSIAEQLMAKRLDAFAAKRRCWDYYGNGER